MRKTGWLRPRNLVLTVVGVLVLAAIAVWRLTPPPPPQMLTTPVTRADLEDAVLATGSVEAYKLVSVGAQVSGQVKSLKVQLGDQVKAGQLIAEIDSLSQQNSLRDAEAALKSTQAQLLVKKATLKQAELAYERAGDLLAQDAGSRESFETAEATLDATRAEIVALEAQIDQGRISVDTARLNLGYTRIVAPMDGTVVAVVTEEGQTVNANQSTPTIIKLARMDMVTIKAEISEADVTRAAPGQRVYFTILGEPDHRYETTLRAIEPAPESISTDSSTTTTTTTSTTSTAIYYNGLLDVPNPDGKLRISMTTQVRIVLADAKNALSIPATALGERGPQGNYLVQVLGSEGRPEPRRVRIGLNNAVTAQVLEGLAEGERVVLGEAAQGSSGSSSRRPMGPPPM
ncbi:MAG: efflux transporter periplasmic adaptor subunit [Candidatus Dactylopiibacterium carminicum]|uniref:Efflux RND transporter periplasmic adaptor subunit n=2 Tax=Candidatus Dactylopiibacterium carminicum TaxID=857335 RepID=A0A272EZ60_9RHOO|nr:efflux RND transporter periplasmic adaptor subunit [Candidatus Dactylopiibacterium carminicum]PAS95418.1 MAG: efflux transporter periplasmic adaptor subunit [Candidatus Dactylopiibacterium carminicum]PAS98723.1 MAG: efflux transporter periplasmic adaptor subunit [Candidatus Dactylopiibacterium carminicum]PAT00903.1 MAG: efflux transporter periplasmic adaptor subunit [Candidatus Dactylopiibacterium carminicum]